MVAAHHCRYPWLILNTWAGWIPKFLPYILTHAFVRNCPSKVQQIFTDCVWWKKHFVVHRSWNFWFSWNLIIMDPLFIKQATWKSYRLYNVDKNNTTQSSISRQIGLNHSQSWVVYDSVASTFKEMTSSQNMNVFSHKKTSPIFVSLPAIPATVPMPWRQMAVRRRGSRPWSPLGPPSSSRQRILRGWSDGPGGTYTWWFWMA